MLNPRSYVKGQGVEVKTRKLFSKKNLPFSYYSLKFCQPNPKVLATESIGEVIFGDQIENSLYTLQMKEKITCKYVKDYVDPNCPKSGSCKPTKANCFELSKKDVEDFVSKIGDDYEAQLIIDNLPVANIQKNSTFGDAPDSHHKDDGFVYLKPDGFPIGCKDGKPYYYVNNHLSFHIKYYLDKETKKYYIVGAGVIPASIEHTTDSCSTKKVLPSNLPKFSLKPNTKSIPWSYSVDWERTETKWGSRWDAYLVVTDSKEYKVHWFSIFNSFGVVLFLTGIAGMIMLRTLNKDIAMYNDDEDFVENTTGWKILHGDVFRPPKLTGLLAITCGTGVQLCLMAVLTVIFAAIGFLSPSNRGEIFLMLILCFAFMGFFAGYFSLRLYKMFGGEYWKTVSFFTAIYFPGIIFFLFVQINITIWFLTNSPLILLITTFLKILGIWLGISLPLVLLGGFIGWRFETYKLPTKVSKIPRLIPEKPWYLNEFFVPLLTGILPFGAIFIELFFLMSSIWLKKFYALFGFLIVVCIILALTCSEISIISTYFQLSSHDYNWWWSSFFNSASSGFYLFLYSIFYFFTKLNGISNIGMGITFYGYMLIGSITFCIITGTIGFFSTFWFVTKMYGSIKVD